ncbi:aromatic ring-hydroxylating dioxygenase subunit alpha, partial [Enterobacter sp. RIT637]|nr:aromatic ring-hydroxylating dioxygenase subunit alpha [Enterobacter sp. RIT637]
MQCDHLITIKNIDTSPQAIPDAAEIAALVQSERVHTSLYTSDDLFQLELDRIFSKTWVWVAHASEIPETGS